MTLSFVRRLCSFSCVLQKNHQQLCINAHLGLFAVVGRKKGNGLMASSGFAFSFKFSFSKTKESMRSRCRF
eukprot:scaffold13101_cov137-Amphora_coffeaeformis.AAC.1